MFHIRKKVIQVWKDCIVSHREEQKKKKSDLVTYKFSQISQKTSHLYATLNVLDFLLSVEHKMRYLKQWLFKNRITIIFQITITMEVIEVEFVFVKISCLCSAEDFGTTWGNHHELSLYKKKKKKKKKDSWDREIHSCSNYTRNPQITRRLWFWTLPTHCSLLSS